MDRLSRTAGVRRWLPAIRMLRLATGLILFSYVGVHLADHALGNISIAAMEAGLLVQKVIWQGWAGTAVLYPALAIHFGLGLWAFYARRHFGWTRAEVAQVTLGLLIPLLLMNHLFVTRIALAQFGLRKGYAQELYSFWVASPALGWLQVAVLVVAWTHGCIGVCLWLRLKPFFQRAAPFLLCGAIVLPMLALLGFCQGGRTVLALAHDPGWRAANLAPWQVGLPAQNALLLRERNISLLLMLGLIGLVLLGRLLRAIRDRRGGVIQVRYPDGGVARIPLGFSILDASRSARIPHASVCGGRARCSTCRVRVVAGGGRVPAASQQEQAVLTRVNAGPGVRLACQLRPDSDISVVPLLPPDWDARELRTRALPVPGEERFIVVLVADMRNSSRLATTRLPFDAVFIIDRFVNAIATAVTEAGGLPNHFTGDGLMATFGLTGRPQQACRQAVDALVLIGRNVTALNRALAADLPEPIGFGIGVHGGPAVVGEFSFAGRRVFTTLGDAANVATRLESLCKEYGCQAVISRAVFALSGYPPVGVTDRQATVRGREAELAVHTITSLVQWRRTPADPVQDGSRRTGAAE
jgi:adenylate cyclase